MEYDRINKAQCGMISPSKLRMKLMGSHNLRKKDGSNSNSSRTSPSKIEDSDLLNYSLLSVGDKEVTSPCLDPPPVLAKENSRGRPQPVRVLEDDNLDYDSNASSSSFEFHRGERSSAASAAQSHGHISRVISRPVPSKWNDAEKWLVSRQNSVPKRTALQNQTNRMMNSVKVAPESGNCSDKFVRAATDTKRVDFCQSGLQIGLDKFSFVPSANQPDQSKDLEESGDLTCVNGVGAIRSVCMRDMGTEMTPMTSLEPSMTSTPIGSITPIRSPTSSMPSTPRQGGSSPAPTPAGLAAENTNNSLRELSEEEKKIKTRREIVALGLRLGKMNIAAWASKDDCNSGDDMAVAEDKRRSREEILELECLEYQKRAAVWEEAEKTKNAARYKREEIKIQAWESQQKAKLEAELRRIEAQVEQMRAQTKAKMVKKIAMTRQRSEEKRLSAEARKVRDAETTAAQAEYIRHTGRTPSSSSQYICCYWL